MPSSKGREITKLGATNYNQWSGEMQAWLRANQLWQIVSGQRERPQYASLCTSSQQERQEAWDDKAKKAAGWIYLMVKTSQTVHLKGLEDDPVAMWDKLKSVHLQQ